MNVKKILVAVIACLVIGAAAVLCFRGCGADVCGDGERTDEVRTELDGAIRNQQQAISDLREVEGTADGIGQAVTAGRGEVQSAIQSNEELGTGNVRTAELIGECQDILRRIRQRGTIEER